jgi:hypothetical protein
MRASAPLVSLALLAAALPAAAAIKLPQASPAAKVALTVGVTDVEISYHRPGVKGRPIWGALVPWDQVWRVGANEATTISFSTAVKVEGKDVPAGTYGLFAIPGKENWTVILNGNAKQWGAYGYKKEEDVLRFEVKPATGAATEWMAFTMWPASETSATVELAWESVRVPFTVSADLEKQVWLGIDAGLAGKPDAEAYLQAASYAMEKNAREKEALAWIDKSLALDDSFWGHEVKAKLLQKQGKVEEAVQHIDKARELAKGKAPREYTDYLDKLKADWQKS